MGQFLKASYSTTILILKIILILKMTSFPVADLINAWEECYLERVMGVEPTYQPWEGRILPMNYTRRKYAYYNRVRGEKQELFLEKIRENSILPG